MPTPVICHDNYLASSATSVVSEDTEAGKGFASCVNGNTVTKMSLLPGSTRDVIVDLGQSKTFRYFCVAVHSLSGTTVNISGSEDDSAYTDIVAISFLSNDVRVEEIPESTYRYVRFRFTGMPSTAYVADMYLGDGLELENGIPVGFVPPEQADKDKIKANFTGRGGLVGLDVERNPKKIRLPLNDYLDTWFLQNWKAMVDNLKSYPGYLLWKDGARALFFVLDGEPGDPKYTYHNRQSVTLNLQGFVE